MLKSNELATVAPEIALKRQKLTAGDQITIILILSCGPKVAHRPGV